MGCFDRLIRLRRADKPDEFCDAEFMDLMGTLRLKLHRLLRSRGWNVDDTDDLIQDAFLRLQLYCKDKPISQPEAFLVRTALNLSVDERRRARRRLSSSLSVEEFVLPDARPLPEEILATQQRIQRARRALEALSPRAREVFLLHRAEGYSYVQIAERLAIGVSTVEKHMAKAALFFDEWMSREEEK